MTMEVARCIHPGCGQAIGGSNHVTLKSNTRMRDDDLRGDVRPGYQPVGGVSEYVLFGQRRAGKVTCVIMRYLMHMVLALTDKSALTTKSQVGCRVMILWSHRASGRPHTAICQSR